MSKENKIKSLLQRERKLESQLEVIRKERRGLEADKARSECSFKPGEKVFWIENGRKKTGTVVDGVQLDKAPLLSVVDESGSKSIIWEAHSPAKIEKAKL